MTLRTTCLCVTWKPLRGKWNDAHKLIAKGIFRPPQNCDVFIFNFATNREIFVHIFAFASLAECQRDEERKKRTSWLWTMIGTFFFSLSVERSRKRLKLSPKKIRAACECAKQLNEINRIGHGQRWFTPIDWCSRNQRRHNRKGKSRCSKRKRKKKQMKRCFCWCQLQSGAKRETIKRKRVRKLRVKYQFRLGSGSLLSSPFGFDFQLLLGQRFQIFVALQLLLLLGGQHEHFIVVIIAEETRVTWIELIGWIGGDVVDRVLTEFIDFANQLCCYWVWSRLAASFLRHNSSTFNSRCHFFVSVATDEGKNASIKLFTNAIFLLLLGTKKKRFKLKRTTARCEW